MPAIGQYTFDAWQGRILPPETRVEFAARTGLAGYGVGFDTDMIEPATIMTRARISAAGLFPLINRYRDLVGTNQLVYDGTESVWRNVLVAKVSNIQWDLQISPAGSYLLTAQWLLLPEIT